MPRRQNDLCLSIPKPPVPRNRGLFSHISINKCRDTPPGVSVDAPQAEGPGENFHVIVTKEALVRQYPSLPFHGNPWRGRWPGKAGSEGVGSELQVICFCRRIGNDPLSHAAMQKHGSMTAPPCLRTGEPWVQHFPSQRIDCQEVIECQSWKPICPSRRHGWRNI